MVLLIYIFIFIAFSGFFLIPFFVFSLSLFFFNDKNRLVTIVAVTFLVTFCCFCCTGSCLLYTDLCISEHF